MSNSSYSTQGTFFGFHRALSDRQLEICNNSFYGNLRNVLIPLMDSSVFDPINSQSDFGRKPIDARIKMTALIIKCVYGLSYDELDNKLEFDQMAKFAFGYEYVDEKPVSARTLRRFLFSCKNYQLETGEDLLTKFHEGIAPALAELIDSDKSLARIDSTFIDSSIHHLSRLEVIFETVRQAVRFLNKSGILLTENLKGYLDQNKSNQIFYYKDSKLSKDDLALELLKDAWETINLFPEDLKEADSFSLLMRVLKEQSTKDKQGNPVLRAVEEITSGSVQSPVDPDATFRIKGGKAHKGYLGTDVEVSNGKESIIIKTRTDQNNKSDSEIIQELLPELKEEEPMDLIADGAYGSTQNQELAQENNINLKPTNLPGKPTSPIHARIILNEERTKVIACPAGHKPKTSRKYSNDQISFSMPKKTCDQCPLKDQCIVKANKNVKNPRTYRGLTSNVSQLRAQSEQDLSPEQKEQRVSEAHFRNGIEALFNDLKRNYGLTGVGSQLRGLIRVGMEHTIAAISRNFKSVYNYNKRMRRNLKNCPIPV